MQSPYGDRVTGELCDVLAEGQCCCDSVKIIVWLAYSMFDVVCCSYFSDRIEMSVCAYAGRFPKIPLEVCPHPGTQSRDPIPTDMVSTGLFGVNPLGFC